VAEYRTICPVGEIPPGTARLIRIDGKDVGLFNVDGAFHAMENTCLHAGGPLHEGRMEGAIVVCPWHGWRFDVTRGTCDLNPLIVLQRYETRVQGKMVEVRASA